MDRQQVEMFVRGEYPRVVAVVGFACGDFGRAEDAVQEVLASLLERKVDITNPSAWIVTAALNRVRSGERRLSAERRALERFRRAAPTDLTFAADLDEEVLGAMRALPARQREIAGMYYLLDFAVADIARALQVSDGTVKTQLHRARSTLRELLDPNAAREEDDHVGR